MRKWIFVGILGLAAFLVVRSQLFVSSETDRLPPQSDEEVRSLLLMNALDYFSVEEGRAPSSIQELQNHPVGRVLNVWAYVQPLQEGEEPPPRYAGWRIENGELVLFLRYYGRVYRHTANPEPPKVRAALRALRQRFAPSPEEAGLFYICSYLLALSRDAESLAWFRSPYEGQPLRWSTLDDPQPVSVTRLDVPNSGERTYVCWNSAREPVNPAQLVSYARQGGTIPAALVPFVDEYDRWVEATPEYDFTPEEVRSGAS